MPKKSLDLLTESMFYLLMALSQGPMCGTDAAVWVERKTGGRVRLGPATLYTILSKFESVGYIREVSVEGRRRTYEMTDRGLAAYRDEVARLQQCLADAENTERGGCDNGEETDLPHAALPQL